jgi:hypothetical protein
MPPDQRKPRAAGRRQRTLSDGRCPIGENFLYVFKGAPSAPRAWRHVTAHATRRESWRKAEGGHDTPAGTHRTTQRPLALARKRTAAAAEARTPGHRTVPAGHRHPLRV